MGITSHPLLGFDSTPQERIHIWYCKHGPKPMAKEVLGSSGETTAVPWLSRHDGPIKLPSEKVCLCPENPGQLQPKNILLAMSICYCKYSYPVSNENWGLLNILP